MRGEAKNLKTKKNPTPKNKQTKKKEVETTELFFPFEKLILQRRKKIQKVCLVYVSRIRKFEYY